MADEASTHQRRVPLKAARDATPKIESGGGEKAKSKAKTKTKGKARGKTAPDPVVPLEVSEEPAIEAQPAEPEPKRGWRRFNIRWGVVLLVGPALVLTPIVLTWATLAIFGPMAGYVAATVKTVRQDRAWSVLCGLFLGLATVAGLVIVVMATLEGMARRRARTQETEASQPATAFALTAAAGVGLVATPLALFFGSTWLSDRAATGTDISRLFTELDLSQGTMRTWVIVGLVLGTAAAAWAAKTGRTEKLKQRTAHAFDEWADAKYDHEVNPDRW